MMRPAEVFVRPLLHEEGVRLKRLSKRARHQCTRQRAAVLLASNVGMTAPQIAEMWRTDASWVRRVIHEFNERGMNSLRPRYRGGRRRRITTDQRQRIVAVAGARPDRQGPPRDHAGPAPGVRRGGGCPPRPPGGAADALVAAAVAALSGPGGDRRGLAATPGGAAGRGVLSDEVCVVVVTDSALVAGKDTS